MIDTFIFGISKKCVKWPQLPQPWIPVVVESNCEVALVAKWGGQRDFDCARPTIRLQKLLIRFFYTRVPIDNALALV